MHVKDNNNKEHRWSKYCPKLTITSGCVRVCDCFNGAMFTAGLDVDTSGTACRLESHDMDTSGTTCRLGSHDMDTTGTICKLGSHDMDTSGTTCRLGSHDMDTRGTTCRLGSHDMLNRNKLMHWKCLSECYCRH